MTSTELVSKRPTTIEFRGGPRRPLMGPHPQVTYTPPGNTCDPRYEACTNHHVACDCREAEWAEERSEQRYARRELQQAFDMVLAGHPTYADDGKPCQCSGCQVARIAHIYPAGAW